MLIDRTLTILFLRLATIYGIICIFSFSILTEEKRFSLIVEVAAVKGSSGYLQYALYDQASSFATRQGQLLSGRVPAVFPVTQFRIRGLRSGTYALAIFHDANSNSEFDQGFLGIPLEDYGFSNDAMGLFKAPNFSDAKFNLRQHKNKIKLTLKR
ncbi:MAG: hypothetical protein CMM44_06920 [Rhodospirillaceae bacterium]|nr:hypothetical protein [Rhodospirillaceae bacterium]